MKVWLNNLGIRNRILVSTILPLVIVAIALGYYMTAARLNDVEHEFMHHGNTMAELLAANSEFGVFTNNRKLLEIVASQILQEDHVVSVAIFDREGALLVGLQKDITDSNAVTEPAVSTLVFSSTIKPSQISIKDYPLQDESTGPPPGVLGGVEVALSQDHAILRQKEILITSIILLIVGILASALLSLAISRTVTRPLQSVINTVRRLQTGKLDSRVPLEFGGELAQLADDINTMASTIQDSQHRLSCEVDQATTDLKAVVLKLEGKNLELEQAREAALEAGRTKSEFLASMSHEIRTPLSAVIGYSRLLEDMEQTEEQQVYTRTITQAATQLLTIIDDILNFYRADSGRLEPDNSEFNLYERFESIVSIQAAAAYEKQLELVLLIHTEVPVTITNDGNRIGQVLTNLIANAIKFTEAGYIVIEVLLRISDDGGSVIEVSVTDTGIGMNSGQTAHIFLPFTQADASTSRKFGGTGLGLAISKQLVGLIGGEIGVSSEPGKGSRFWFTIPTDQALTGYQQPHQPLAARRILVYDQNSFSRRAIRNRLLNWGASVFVSTRWMDMLEKLEAAQHEDKPYHLLVLGLSVQEYGSRLVTEIIDDVRQLISVPILLLMGAEAQRLSSKHLEHTAVKLISKPPRGERMLRAIQSLLGNSETIPEHDVIGGATDHVTDTRLTGMQILLAEDNQFNQDLTRHLLESLGVTVTIAADGQQAFGCASAQLFDLIFMDIHMPGMGGIEASQIIRSGPNRDTPIICLSADVFACEEELSGTDMQACITKPVSREQLAEIILSWVRPGSGEHQASSPPDASHETTLPEGMEQQLQAELTAQITSLRSACQDADHDAMRDHLHQLKGISDYFQQPGVRRACDSLHVALTEDDRPAALAVLDQLDAILEPRHE